MPTFMATCCMGIRRICGSILLLFVVTTINCIVVFGQVNRTVHLDIEADARLALLMHYKAIEFPMNAFPRDGFSSSSSMPFCLKMVVNFAGEVVQVDVQPVQGLSSTVRPDSVWKMCAEAIRESVLDWMFYDVTDTDYVGPVTKDYLQQFSNSCWWSPTLFEFYYEKNRRTFKYTMYMLILVKDGVCTAEFTTGVSLVAKSLPSE